MGFEPQGARSGAWINAGLFPPCCLIATAMDLAVMPAAERYRKLVAHLTAERAWLSKAQMVWIGWRATANQAGLPNNEPHMLAIANSAGFGVTQFALVDTCGGIQSIRFARADFAAFADPVWPFELRKFLSELRLNLFGVCRD